MSTAFIRVLTLLLALTARGIHGYSAGAPLGQCAAMTPNHGPQPQTTPSPFAVTPSKMNYSAGESLTVTLAGDTFKGFLLQARSGDTPVGMFTSAAGDNTQTLDCSDNSMSALTHTSGFSKTTLTVTWTAPQQSSGTVRFRATFVKTKPEFWVGVESADIMYMSSMAGGGNDGDGTGMGGDGTSMGGGGPRIASAASSIISSLLFVLVCTRLFLW